MTDGIRIDSSEFQRVSQQAKEFSDVLSKQMEQLIRRAGETAAAGIKAALGSGGPVRRALAAGTSVQPDHSGIRIVTSADKLPAGHKAMASLYDKPSWRHPVFGTRAIVTQRGRPYFGTVIAKHRAELAAAVDAALAGAARAMDAGR